MDKKELFKYIITEFNEFELPVLYERDLVIPNTAKIITLVGPRRAGKTFYFYQLIKNLQIPKGQLLYINFEDDRILPLSDSDLQLILEAYYELFPENKNKRIYVFFDEIQNIPSWELFVRRIYDKENVKLYITGSNSKLLAKEIATGLRGRTLAFSIFPLSFGEFLSFNNIKVTKSISYSKERYALAKLFDKYLAYGGFPEVVLEKNHLEQKILNSYFEIMIYKDIVDRYLIRNTSLLKVLSKYLLTNISNIFSINAYYTALKETTSIGKETVFEYVSYLEEANLIFLVPFFSYSLKKQQANPKKVYCIDAGLRNAVCFRFSGDTGRLAENIVFIELKRREKEIYYWQHKNQVDFVVKEHDASLIAINVCYEDKFNEREIQGLLDFKKEFGQRVADLVILTKNFEKQEKGVKYLPLWKWLLFQ